VSRRTRIIFWKPTAGHDPWEQPEPSGRAMGNAWAEEFRQGHALPQLEPISVREFIDGILRRFPDAREEEGVVPTKGIASDSDLEIRWGDQHIEVLAYKLSVPTDSRIMELAEDLELDWFDFRA
jgi:hypothetical protein